jgi:hypothetical protein
MSDMAHYLIVFDKAHSALLREEAFSAHVDALRERFQAERLYTGRSDIEVVVLSADSAEALRNTHSRYFERLTPATA